MERLKVKKLAVGVTYLAACGLMYWTAKVLYGGAVELGGYFTTLVILPIMHLIIHKLQKEPAPKQSSKAGRVIVGIVFGALIAFCVYIMVKEPGQLYTWALGTSMFGAAVIWMRQLWQKRKGEEVSETWVDGIGACYGLILLGTILFIFFAPTAQVGETQKALADAGYEDVAYAFHANRVMYAVAEKEATGEVTSRDPDWTDMGLYLFEATKDSERVGVFVEVYGGEVAGAFPLVPNGSLEFYLN